MRAPKARANFFVNSFYYELLFLSIGYYQIVIHGIVSVVKGSRFDSVRSGTIILRMYIKGFRSLDERKTYPTDHQIITIFSRVIIEHPAPHRRLYHKTKLEHDNTKVCLRIFFFF